METKHLQLNYLIHIVINKKRLYFTKFLFTNVNYFTINPKKNASFLQKRHFCLIKNFSIKSKLQIQLVNRLSTQLRYPKYLLLNYDGSSHEKPLHLPE